MRSILRGLLPLMLLWMPVGMADQNKGTVEMNGFDRGISEAASVRERAFAQFSKFTPADAFKNGSGNPALTQYYGERPADDSRLKEDARQLASTSPIAGSVQDVIAAQKGIDKDRLADETATAGEIQKKAGEMAGSISGEFSDCIRQQSCTVTWSDKACDAVPPTVTHTCQQTLHVSMVPHEIRHSYPFSLHLHAKDHVYAGVTVNLVSGAVVFMGPHEARMELNGRLPAAEADARLEGRVTGKHSDNPETRIDDIRFPSSKNPVFSMHLNGRRGSADMQASFTVDAVRTEYRPEDSWEDGCAALASMPGCDHPAVQCVAPEETRLVSGIPVTRDCWRKEVVYACGASEHDRQKDTCHAESLERCQQSGFECVKGTDISGTCTLYHRTYRCPSRVCTETGTVCNGTAYCLTGDCVSRAKTTDPDFQKAATALSAVFDAGTGMDQQTRMVFAGLVMECDDLALGAANCCRETGWLIDDLSLYRCSAGEKALGRARENGQAHYVGREESGCAGNACLKKTRTFCVFPSLLARIVQEQGRAAQLGRGFGNARHPDCSGLLPEELQKLDFGKMDFSEFYASLGNWMKEPDEQALNHLVSEKMQKMASEGAYHASHLPS